MQTGNQQWFKMDGRFRRSNPQKRHSPGSPLAIPDGPLATRARHSCASARHEKGCCFNTCLIASVSSSTCFAHVINERQRINLVRCRHHDASNNRIEKNKIQRRDGKRLGFTKSHVRAHSSSSVLNGRKWILSRAARISSKFMQTSCSVPQRYQRP